MRSQGLATAYCTPIPAYEHSPPHTPRHHTIHAARCQPASSAAPALRVRQAADVVQQHGAQPLAAVPRRCGNHLQVQELSVRLRRAGCTTQQGACEAIAKATVSLTRRRLPPRHSTLLSPARSHPPPGSPVKLGPSSRHT